MTRITSQQSSLALLAVTGLAASLLSRRAGVFGPEGPISRRTLMKLGGLGVASFGTVAWTGRAAATWLSHAPRSAVAARAVSCVLTPEQTEGPYYIAKEKVRKNIVEHKHGTPLALRFAVVDATTCTPIKGAAVDIWHCDAAGVYAGFGSASTGGGPGGPGGNAGPTDKLTFLRGIQPTDARGACAFQTIYPGWYRGRTVHIHVKVHLGGSVVHTGQLFFADSLTDTVYQTGVYKARAAARDTRNSGDSIYASGGAQSTLTMTRTAVGGYVGTITLGVRRS